CQLRGVSLRISIITNGLLLTPEVVDRLLPFGLKGIKITLDGDRDTHNRMRPLRGGQGTFDRIVENVRRVADKVAISIGGNFDASSVDSYPDLLDFLMEQEFADKLAKVAFKPIIREKTPEQPKGLIPVTAVNASGKPLGGTCMTSAGAGSSICDTCHFVDEKMSFLREETRKRGFKTVDGVHMGPCEIHKRHAHTIGPDGALYACPGFTGEPKLSVGHIQKPQESWQAAAEKKFDVLAAWKQCGDCAYIPVCAGGCSVASHTELGDMNTPTCHKSSFDSALISLAHSSASSLMEITQ
ncbi:MAG: SPASM domain-containing protein, partial [Vicinamibacterales bacterium]